MSLVDALRDPSRPVFLFGARRRRERRETRLQTRACEMCPERSSARMIQYSGTPSSETRRLTRKRSTDRVGARFSRRSPGVTPALDGSSEDASRDAAEGFVAKTRGLACDGYIVYDIQEEAGRTAEPRPFPFRKLGDPGTFAKLLKRASGGTESVVYKCVAEEKSEDAFRAWLKEATKATRSYNLVGGASSSQSYAGPTIKRAAELLRGTKRGCAFGGVTIAERHAKKGNEHETLCAKTEAGAEWFISQAIFDADMTIKLLNDYGRECKKRGIAPKRVVLTFAPCGREKTMKFIKWLGCSVPADVERDILGADNPAQKSVELLVAMCEKIILETKDSGVPLGVSVESVSIFKNEQAAARDLFRLCQAVMLDASGHKWSMRYQLDKKPKNKSLDVVKSIAGVAALVAAASRALRGAGR